jgi:hypothetical protein
MYRSPGKWQSVCPRMIDRNLFATSNLLADKKPTGYAGCNVPLQTGS